MPEKNKICWILAICFCIFAISVCRVRLPNFDALYLDLLDAQESAEVYFPVIIIAALLGSRLVDTKTDKKVWPGSLFDVALGRYRDLVLDFDAQHSDQQTLGFAGIAESKLGVISMGNYCEY